MSRYDYLLEGPGDNSWADAVELARDQLRFIEEAYGKEGTP